MQDESKIDVAKVISHWVDSSEKDLQTMQHLHTSKDNDWALFLGHIMLEKLLKALVVKKTKAHAPFTHDLLRLANLAGLTISEEQSDWLDTITTFNINTRYDSYKQEFYKKCTPEFTVTWVNRTIELQIWIKKKL
jgi:HEPN domain-containing protein